MVDIGAIAPREVEGLISFLRGLGAQALCLGLFMGLIIAAGGTWRGTMMAPYSWERKRKQCVGQIFWTGGPKHLLQLPSKLWMLLKKEAELFRGRVGFHYLV